MTTALHTPSHSPQTSDFFSRQPQRQMNPDYSFSLGFSPNRHPSATPSRKQSTQLPSFSPVKNRLDLNNLDAAMQLDFDDFSSATAAFSTPFRPAVSRATGRQPRSKATQDPFDLSRRQKVPLDEEELFFGSRAAHMSLPLRTPERSPLELPRDAHSSNIIPSPSHPPKRKINLMSSSPKLGLTPLHIRHSFDENGIRGLATLAPLQAPRFSRNENAPCASVIGDDDVLKKMRISDKFDLDSDSSGDELSGIKTRRNVNRTTTSREGLNDIVNTISPDGHVAKRRVRSRPVSSELLTIASPSPKSKVQGRHKSSQHHRNSSNTSVSETGSPMKRTKPTATKPEFDRIVSSATLFFGPAIDKSTFPNMDDNRSSLYRSSSNAMPPSTPIKPSTADDVFSPSSPDSSFTSAFARPAETSISFNLSVNNDSPQKRIPLKFKKSRDSAVVVSDDDTDESLLNALAPHQVRSSRNQSQAQPSTSYSTSSEATLIDESLITPSNEPSKESAWPDSSLDFSLVDEFIVKTLEAGAKDDSAIKRMPDTPQKRTKTAFLGAPMRRQWASAIIDRTDRTPLMDERIPGPDFSNILDSGGSGSDGSVQRVTHLSKGKPRKSCPGDFRFPSIDLSREDKDALPKSGGSSIDTSPSRARVIQPRMRTYGDVGLGKPSTRFNATQLLMRRSSSGAFSVASDISEGAGTPTRKKNGEFRVPMLPLRSQYTPSTNTIHLSPDRSPIVKNGELARPRNQLPFSGKHMKENRRPESFIESSVRLRSPTRNGRLVLGGIRPRSEFENRHQIQPQKAYGARASLPAHLDNRLGRFEREFIEVDKIGAGEFGSVMKVRYKDTEKDGDRVLALKRSKPFEGNRQRSRMNEEVEVLRKLSEAAGPAFHPNVLGYIDSWEEDQRLYILTELCEFGNFAHFLTEYGHHFAKLDEARVWKIFADISTGLRFIHRANIAHFDLKPANIFITAAGRFKIGDFGMASFWPRQGRPNSDHITSSRADVRNAGFEREGDKMYLAAEVLQGRYGKATDIFSFGMTMLETATNIVVPAQGELWHLLREEDLSPVEGLADLSEPLVSLIQSMMRKDPARRPDINSICSHPVVSRARARMEQTLKELRAQGESRPDILFKASPLASVDATFLQDILGLQVNGESAMDWTA